ncbi:hypothetical protein [Spartinivicinus poritis]|uniref:Replication protein n=1 Tax=Spartinivicinus poritis TaxID=2994640 RepID=A0ABT5UHG4_9GAMM|nr:hypothetical protein [Spartinivicinus sp. A2-2]MDE1465843.1 hypothetical protein [Spartinivicinus sp. A2-2]
MSKKDLRLSEPAITPHLSFFQLLEAQDADYSNAVDFYDHIPKFLDTQRKRYWSYKDVTPKVSTEFSFNYKGTETTFVVTIKPGRITKNIGGKETDVLVYPSIQREESVYDALRKLATSENGAFFKEDLGTMFTLRMLQKELKRFNKTMSIPELTESLEVLRSAEIEIVSLAGEFKWKPSYLSNMALTTRKDILQDGQSNKCLVLFDSFVTNSVKQLEYREYNYAIAQSAKKPIAKYLIKRMDRRYKQASQGQFYPIKMSTVFKATFRKMDKKMSNNTRQMKAAIEEMKKLLRLEKVEIEPIKSLYDKRKTVDYLYKLYPHDRLVSDMKRFNKKYSIMKNRAALYEERQGSLFTEDE